MELVSQHAARTGAIKTPPLVLAAIAAIAAISIAVALLWTSPRVSPSQVGNHLLSPALIQVRMSERTADTVGSAGRYQLDPALISLRRGEKARLDRGSSADNRLPNRAPVHVGKGPLAGGQ